MAPDMIRACGLSRRFGAVHALRDLSFEVGPGEVVGFLGPNGAGKTTTIRILTGDLAASGGRAFVAGRPVDAADPDFRRALGWLPEANPLPPEATPAELLAFAASIRGLRGPDLRRRRDEVVDRCALGGWLDRPTGALSKGTRQRVGLAVAVLCRPPVLVLDEPSSGLDPHQVREIRSLVADLGREHTVLMSSHALAEVRAVATRVLVLHQGRLVAEGPLATLGREELAVQVAGADEAALGARLRAFGAEVRIGAGPEPGVLEALLPVAAGEDLRARIAAAVVGEGWALLGLARRPPDIERMFDLWTRDTTEAPA